MDNQTLKVILYDELEHTYTIVCLVCGASCSCLEAQDDEEYIEMDLQHLLTCALAAARVRMLMN